MKEHSLDQPTAKFHERGKLSKIRTSNKSVVWIKKKD